MIRSVKHRKKSARSDGSHDGSVGKEVAAETLLASKGFAEAVVSLSEDSADVVVNASELSDANRAQIEDIITRKDRGWQQRTL